MADYGFEPYAAEPEPEPPVRSRLPGGISPQTAAAVLLIAIVLATLYLFFGPLPDDGAALPATPTAPAPTSAAPSSAATSGAAGGLAAVTPSPATLVGVATVPFGLPTSATPSMLGASTPTPSPLGATVDGGAPAGSLAIGTYVSVRGVGADGLRYRMGAGADNLTIRIVAEGETFKVLGGPETADGTAFWRVQDAFGNVGWAAELYLTPAAAPFDWNPPLASPTFEADGAAAP